MKNRAKFSFWGENWLEMMGMTVGVGLLMYVFMCFGSNNTYGGSSFLDLLPFLPYYIMAAGSFCVLIIGVTYFQTYFSVLVSMNATRRRTVIGILSNITVMLLSVLAMMFLIWKEIPGEISEAGLRLMPLFAGILFLAAALCVMLGAVIARWGKIGMIIFAIFGMMLGGCIGASFVVIDSGKVQKLVELVMSLIGKFEFGIVTVAGIVAFLLSGIFAAVVTRKIEVRV